MFRDLLAQIYNAFLWPLFQIESWGNFTLLFTNYLADANCDAAQIRVTVPGYTEQMEFELEQIQVYARFLLLDNVTGYRSQYQEYSTLLTAL